MIIVRPQPNPEDPQDPLALQPRAVWPVRYRSAELRRYLGQLIGKADSDELLAAYFWVSEGRSAQVVLKDIAKDLKWIRDWRDNAEAHISSPEPYSQQWTYTRRELNDVVRSFIDRCNREILMLNTVEAKVSEQFIGLRDRFGTDLAPHYTPTEDESPMDLIMDAWERTTGLCERFSDTIAKQNAAVVEVANLEKRRREFVASGRSVSDREIQQFDYLDFEDLTATLLRRDGLTVVREGGGPRDHGADVIAVTPDGRRVVVQCKLRQRGPIGPNVVYQVNGTARPVHNADIPIIVTNSTFSAQATEFARSQDVYLVGDYGLRRWATWGDDLYELLGIDSPSGDAEVA